MQADRRTWAPGPVVGALALWLAQLARPARALAHDGEPPAPHDLWYAWNFDLLILGTLLISSVLFARGVRDFRDQGRPVAWWRPAAFYAALFAAAVALISPLDALSGSLFSAHMVQHLLLIMVTAPLISLAAPLAPLLRGLPRGLQKDLGQGWNKLQPAHRWLRWLGYGWIAWLLHAAAVWLWHLPGPYQAALRNDFLHAVEHAALLGTALLYWSTIVPISVRRREAGGWAFLSLVAMAIQGSVLGALMTFSPQPWYPAYAETVLLWGLTPLEDQQVAGVLMWVPPGIVYMAAAIGLFGVWLGRMENGPVGNRPGPSGDTRDRNRRTLLPGPAPSPRKES